MYCALVSRITTACQFSCSQNSSYTQFQCAFPVWNARCRSEICSGDTSVSRRCHPKISTSDLQVSMQRHRWIVGERANMLRAQGWFLNLGSVVVFVSCSWKQHIICLGAVVKPIVRLACKQLLPKNFDAVRGAMCWSANTTTMCSAARASKGTYGFYDWNLVTFAPVWNTTRALLSFKQEFACATLTCRSKSINVSYVYTLPSFMGRPYVAKSSCSVCKCCWTAWKRKPCDYKHSEPELDVAMTKASRAFKTGNSMHQKQHFTSERAKRSYVQMKERIQSFRMAQLWHIYLKK